MFSFGGDDDDADFTPGSSQGGLKSLFGGGDGDSQSLKFSAPKQPKSSEAKPKETAGVKFAVAAQTYHYQNNVYNPKGKLGVAVTNSNSVLIYGAKQRVLSNCQINPNTAFSVTEKNFVSFYDDAQNCWGVMFDNELEISKFLCLTTICKLGDTTVKQDLSKVSNTDKIATLGSTITVSYTGWLVENDAIGKKFDANNSYSFKLGAGNVIRGWDEALVGCHEGRDYFVVIPPASGYGSNGRPGVIPPDSVLSFKITITSIKVEEPPPSPSAGSVNDLTNMNDITDSSSLESVPINSRPAETTGPRNDIISRMARMGAQPAFAPMEPSSPDDPRSRSSSTRSNRSKRKPSRADSTQSSVEPKPVVPMKPGPLVPHTMMNGNYGNFNPQQYGQVQYAPIAQTTPPEIKETLDVSKTMSNSIQSIDLTIKSLESKIDSLHQKTLLFSNAATASPSLDTQLLMYNIQRVVSENDSLRSEMKDKNKHIEKQCEKVTELLDKNQQLMHLKNEAMEQTQNNFMANSNQSAQQITGLEQEKDELSRELKTLRSESANRRFEDESKNTHISSLKAQIESLYTENMKLQSSVFETRNEFAAFKMSSSMGGQEDILKNELSKMKSRMDTCLLEKLEVSQQLDDERFSQREAQFQFKSQISRLEKELEMVKLQSGEDVIAKKYEDTISALQAELGVAKENVKNKEGEVSYLKETVSNLQMANFATLEKINNIAPKMEKLSEKLSTTTAEKDVKAEEIQQLKEQIMSNEARYQAELETSSQATSLAPSVDTAALERTNNELQKKLSTLALELANVKSSVNDTVKKIINKVFMTFREEVEISESYSGRDVLTLAMRIIKQVTLEMMKEGSESESDESSEEEDSTEATRSSVNIPGVESDDEQPGPSNQYNNNNDTAEQEYNTPPSESVTFQLPQNTLNDFLSPEVAQEEEIPHFSPEPLNRDPIEELHDVLERDIHDVIEGGDIVQEEPVPEPDVVAPAVIEPPLIVPQPPVLQPNPLQQEPPPDNHDNNQAFFPDLDEEDLWVQAPAEPPAPPSPSTALSFEPNVVLEIEDNTVEEVFGARPEAVQVSPSVHRYNRPPPLFSDSEDDDLGFLS